MTFWGENDILMKKKRHTFYVDIKLSPGTKILKEMNFFFLQLVLLTSQNLILKKLKRKMNFYVDIM